MSKTKIMIVEDEFIVAEDIKNSLEHLGYAVCAHAASGEDPGTWQGYLRRG